MHPDELAPTKSDMDPEGWDLIAMAAIHQGAGECAIEDCKACNYQPEAARKNEETEATFFTVLRQNAGVFCSDCQAVERGEQIVCPKHSVASASFMIQADKEAHLTLQGQPLTRFSDQATAEAQQSTKKGRPKRTGAAATPPTKDAQNQPRTPQPTQQRTTNSAEH
jgi:hypothetical protein